MPGSSPRPAPRAREKSEYLAQLDGMVYGEDPSEGFVRGRRFLHPKLGFTFTAPDGFMLENTAQAVFGVKDGGEQALRLDVVRVPAEQTLSEYLVSGWIENIDENSVAEFTVSGFPAATATATGDHWTFRLYAVRFGSEVYRVIFAAKNRTDAVDRTFRETAQHVPPHERGRNAAGEAAAAQGGDGAAGRTHLSGWPAGWRSATARSSISA